MIWEYEAIKQDDLTRFISDLNTAGQGGWELVSVTRKPLLNKQKALLLPLLKCVAERQAEGRFNI